MAEKKIETNKIEKVKSKIQALLNKTVDNGATEEEMFSAMKLAERLMRKYAILKSELPKQESKETCILKSVDKISGYKTVGFLGALSSLFDCEHYYTKSKISFFGFEDDVDLCIYFYKRIIEMCFLEKEKFFNTDDGKELLKYNHGRTVASSFIKGFIYRMEQRIYDMYIEKKNDRDSKVKGLVVAKKREVEDQYKSLGVNPKEVVFKYDIKQIESFERGKQVANKVDILKPIK